MSEEKKLIAMLGGGQLGLMFVQKAQMMGERVLVLDPDPDCPAGKIADEFINASYLDETALKTIVDSCSSCTTEFENIPFETLEILEKKIDVYPKSNALRITQNRILEKGFLKEIGIPTTEYYEIKSKEELDSLEKIKNWPYIIKTSTFGYDGKGQIIVNNYDELKIAYEELGSNKFILEKKVKLKKEVSQVAASYKNNIIYLPISENIHINNILHKSIVPADIDNGTTELIKNITEKIIKNLNYGGIICIEFFIDENETILVNEIAPRTHNSGHYSIEGCNVSQFEHQVNILTNKTSENSNLKIPSVMINILGDLWEKNDPDFNKNKSENIYIHLYNKTVPKKGRKMGHITVTSKILQKANTIAEKVFQELN